MQRNDAVLDQLDEIFDRCDEDGDRCIGFDEFRGLMLELADSRADSALRVCFEEIDRNHDGRISCQELRAWWPTRHPATT
jgi:Ca2+-binding EF-hand superfamily protein